MRLALVALLAAGCATNPATDGGRPTRELDVGFKGNTTFSDSRLRGTIALDLENLERRSSPKSAIDDAAFSIVEFYRSQGFPDCTVDYDVRSSAEGEVSAALRIAEGPRTALEDFDIEGAAVMRESEAIDALGFAVLDGLLGPRWYVESEIESARVALANLYQGLGFVEVVVDEPRVTFNEARTKARVTLTVREGPRMVIAGLTFEPGGIARIEREINWQRFLDLPAAQRVLFDLGESIEEAYARRGHPDVTVEVHEAARDERGRVRLSARVAPGPEVRIGEIVVRGNDKTSRSQIVQRLELEPGDRYDVVKLRDGFRALNRTGLFRRVRIELEPGDAAERALIVELEEGTSTEFYVEPGFGSYEGGRVLVGVRENNIFGTTRTASLEGLLAERAERLALGITEPRLFGSEFEAGLSVFQESRDEPSFDSLERGLSLTLSRNIDRRLRTGIEYRLRRSEISDVDAAAILPADVADVDISSVQFSIAWDERDALFDPSSGNLLRLSAELADAGLGSELDYWRLRLAESAFFPLGRASVLALAWRAGVIIPTNRTEVIPLQERFFNGGENSVRSFEENELGPKDVNGEPLGGEAFQALTLELRRNIYSSLDGALFGDAGTLEEQSDDLFRFEDVRSALGAGLRYQLPVGPLRVDYGWNPDKRPGEDTWVVHFSIGMSF